MLANSFLVFLGYIKGIYSDIALLFAILIIILLTVMLIIVSLLQLILK